MQWTNLLLYVLLLIFLKFSFFKNNLMKLGKIQFPMRSIYRFSSVFDTEPFTPEICGLEMRGKT